MNAQTIIESGRAVLGIEFGSTRIKAVLVDEENKPIAQGSHTWENQLIDGLWTYSIQAIWEGLQDCYASLRQNVKEQYGIEITRLAAIGISAMMHGYMPFGEDDKITGSKNRGIKGADEIRIDSSRVRVRTENGWNEGLSTHHKVLINNSLVELKTRDDAISAGDPETADIEINNSHVFAYSGMDAIDSNGTLHIDDGVIFVIAQTHLWRGFDCDQKEFKIGPNATIVSLGEITSPPTASLLEHPACLVTHSINDAEFCLSTTGSNDNIVSYQKPKFRYSDANYKVLLSVPQFKQNVSYDFCRRATISNPKHTFHGLSIGGTADNKVVVAKHTFNKNYNDYSLPTPPRPPKNGMLNRTGAMAATPAGATAGTPGATAAPTEPQASTKTTKKGSKSKPQNNAAPVNAPDNAQERTQTGV